MNVFLIGMRFYPQGSFIFHGMGSVDEQVHEHLVELVGIAVDLRNFPEFFDHLGPIFQLVMRQGPGAVQALVNISLLQLNVIQPREVLQTLHDLRYPLTRRDGQLVVLVEHMKQFLEFRITRDIVYGNALLQHFVQLDDTTRLHIRSAVHRSHRAFHLVSDPGG